MILRSFWENRIIYNIVYDYILYTNMSEHNLDETKLNSILSEFFSKIKNENESLKNYIDIRLKEQEEKIKCFITDILKSKSETPLLTNGIITHTSSNSQNDEAIQNIVTAFLKNSNVESTIMDTADVTSFPQSNSICN